MLRDGGGRLSDDIPPPTTAEREAAEVERANAVPPIADEPEPPQPSMDEHDEMRVLLRHALRELEAIRAMLPSMPVSALQDGEAPVKP